MEAWKLTRVEELVKEEYESPESRVRLARMQGAKLMIVKQRKGHEFKKELCVQRFLSKAAPTHFPRLYDYSLSRQEMLLEMCDYHSAYDQIASHEDRGLPRNSTEAIKFIFDLLIALEVMHRNGITHGDVALRHILITYKSRPKLTGFRQSRFFRRCGNPAFHRDIVQLADVVCCILSRDLHAGTTLPEAYESQQLQRVLSLMRNEQQPANLTQILLTLREANSTIDLSSMEVLSMAGLATLMDEEEKEATRGVVFNEDLWDVPEASGVERRVIRMELVAGLLDALCQQRLYPEHEIRELFEEMQSLRSAGDTFSVNLTPRITSLCESCRFPFPSTSLVSLACTHCFCPPCFSQSLHSLSSGESLFSQIACWVCHAQFYPLSDSYASKRSIELTIFLTEWQLREETVACSNCKESIFIEDDRGSNPTSVKCPKCKYKFCSYCSLRAHIFRCGKYYKDMKTARQHA